MERKRSREEIFLDILNVVNNGIVIKTQIMQRASLDLRTFQRYFLVLLEKGFLRREKINGREIYWLTEKGRMLLSILKELEGILREEK